MPKDGDLRVWWVPQMPMTAFMVSVKNEHEADLILRTLAHYDEFQYENSIKPDYANEGGLEIFEDGDWVTWHKEVQAPDGVYSWDDFDEYRKDILHAS